MINQESILDKVNWLSAVQRKLKKIHGALESEKINEILYDYETCIEGLIEETEFYKVFLGQIDAQYTDDYEYDRAREVFLEDLDKAMYKKDFDVREFLKSKGLY